MNSYIHLFDLHKEKFYYRSCSDLSFSHFVHTPDTKNCHACSEANWQAINTRVTWCINVTQFLVHWDLSRLLYHNLQITRSTICNKNMTVNLDTHWPIREQDFESGTNSPMYYQCWSTNRHGLYLGKKNRAHLLLVDQRVIRHRLCYVIFQSSSTKIWHWHISVKYCLVVIVETGKTDALSPVSTIPETRSQQFPVSSKVQKSW